MSVSAVSDVSQSLQTLLQRLQNNPQTTPATATTATSPTAGIAPTTSDSGDASAVQPAAHRHHHGKGGQFFKQVQDAVTSALQSSKDSPNADPNKTIEDAIAGVLQNNPDALQAFQARIAQAGNNPPADAAQAAKVQPGPGTSNPDGTTSSRAAFQQLLQSFGVDPQQFRNDFLTAIKDAQNGQVNPASALQSVPAGATVDISA